MRWICGDRVFTSAREGEGGLERGATLTLAAIILPLVMVLGAVVVDIGNWWVHGRHLQTKVDVAVFAGGGVWGFPCAPDTDLSIENLARKYVGQHMQADGSAFSATTFNPQVGGTPGSQIHVVLNGSTWWDDDEGAAPADMTTPSNPSICDSMILDVKATEANSNPLFGWVPFIPDIKRKARVEIRQIEGLTGLIPISVRNPKPLSVAAIFYDEANGNLLSVRYFREDNTIFGLPAGLGGYTTFDPAAPGSNWANVDVAPETGVVIAFSFRPACSTPGATPPCFANTGFTTVNELCNQGSTLSPPVQIVECYYRTGTFPTQSVQSGLHFIRGYPTTDPGTGPPELRSAYLQNISCPANGYFNAGFPPSICQAQLNLKLNLGSLNGLYPNPSPPPPDVTEQLRASDVEVRYRLVRGDVTSSCDYGVSCDLEAANAGGTSTVTFSTTGSPTSPHLPITAFSLQNAVAIQVRLRNAINSSNPDCVGGSFNDNCRWFYTGNGVFGTSVAPTDAQILAAPIQRSFYGGIDTTGPVKWLRLTTDPDCDGDPGLGAPFYFDNDAASQPLGQRCFYMDMGLKGGAARDQDEPPVAFNEGTGSSQMGSVDCDPNIQQGQVLTEGVVKGCSPFYAANKFNTNPLCPGTAGFFTLPKPPPFDDWAPYDCIKTRPTGQMSQITSGLNERIFGDPTNPSCPPDYASGYVQGRNYWHRDNNLYKNNPPDPNDPNKGANFRWDGDTPTIPTDDVGNKLRDDDPRLVTLFFSTYESFNTTGQETYPLVGFGAFYITGWGRIIGGQLSQIDDPCPDGNDGDLYNGNGNEPPPDLMVCGGNCGGRAVWGHFVTNVVLSPNSTPSDVICQPQLSLQPCVAVLVE